MSAEALKARKDNASKPRPRTIAKRIVVEAANCSDAMDRAAELCDDPDQDWVKETTTYKFSDGSKLIVSGPYYVAK